MTEDVSDLVGRVALVIEHESERLVERRLLFELLMLALIAREHVLFIGPPGTGKSAAVKLAAQQFQGRYFEYLIGRFTEPGELFGALDLVALGEGEMRPVTRNMLPEANIAFLDEVFLGSTAILNALLGILNERQYRRGAYSCTVPLWTCVGASNALPDDPGLRAFADRFLLTAFVVPVGDAKLGALLDLGWQDAQRQMGQLGAGDAPSTPPAGLSADDLAALTRAASRVDLGDVLEPYAHIMRKLRVRGLELSDRRVVRGQKLVAAAALLANRKRATAADLWPVLYLVQDEGLQEEVKEFLAAELADGENEILRESVRQSSFGQQSLSDELGAYGRSLLHEKPPISEGAQQYEAWQVKVEALLIRLDAGYSDGQMPSPLAALRHELAAAASEA